MRTSVLFSNDIPLSKLKPPNCVIPALRSFAGIQTRSKFVFRKVNRFMAENKEVVICLHRSRGRSSSDAIQRETSTTRKVMVTSANGFECAEASLINAICLVRGHSTSSTVIDILRRRKSILACEKLGHLSELLRTIPWSIHRCSLVRVKEFSSAQASKRDLMDYLISLRNGVYLCRLVSVEQADHTVCIEVSDDSRSIHDSSLPGIFPLSRKHLDVSSDSSSPTLIKELRLLHPKD